ncbi:type II toxin-antitoxin system RelE/ParE family toxin [Bradyrhizobium jicamae]|uniref:type II toxin-antitoxin system RelE/ParE family toxin n=1 Tax=Bradyrhizobium jicamae TaxID=280332 RepID=UPI001BA569B0|nr:type II toxin-antitoxin system RelE/ParE family toxin [Bradyrhizobium jicamae]MBR0752710.1 type II toxin-antitoxin system RelE/ParE family toxin [Bradyrhizobium jicamae]
MQRGRPARAVYTVRFAGVIYILHAFQKKSRKGIPKNEIDLIQSRLRDAEHHYKERMGKGERKP